MRRCGDYWWSKSKYLPEKVLSKQSGLRSLVIKGIGGDFEIAKILSSAKIFGLEQMVDLKMIEIL